MKTRFVFVPLLALFACSTQAALVWQPSPPEKTPTVAKGTHAGHGGKGGNSFMLQGAIDNESQAEVELLMPTLVRRPLALNGEGRVSVRGTGINGYHMLFAKKQSEADEDVAMRYLSLRGKPVDVSPSLLVNQQKASLDITPAPLTREHQRYLSMKPITFLIRYLGEPQKQQLVKLATTNGSEIAAVTDERGRVTFTLPDDFNDVQVGRSNNQPADFTVATAMEVDGRHYYTTVSAPYYVSPSHWQSFTGGLMAMFAGAISGLVVLQRSRNRVGKNIVGEA